MHRSAVALVAILLFVTAAVAVPPGEVVRLEVKEKLIPGRHAAVFAVYAAAEGGAPIASETVGIVVDANGAIVTPLGSLLHLASSGEDRWLSVRVADGTESARVKMNRTGAPPTTVHVVTDAAITANGIVESIAQGFRFPDGSVQTSAATASGGVPSVNGIGSAVTIAGAGSVSVGTAGSTITVTGPSYGSPVAIGTSNADGVASSVARSDHAHAHGNLSGGSLHSNATTGTAGFLSASDKTKLDSLVAYAKTIVVSPTGADATANGTLLISAMTGISGNSSTNPYLLKIEPGVYNIGTTALTMKQYVDIEGSGENATFITATRGAGSVGSAAAAVIGAINSEIRNLTITNASSSVHVVGYYASGSGSFRLKDVTVNVSGATTTSWGVYSASSAVLYLFHSTVTVTSTGSANGNGVYAAVGGTTTFISNCTITAKGPVTGGTGGQYAVQVNSSTAVVYIDSSTVIATGTANYNYGVYVTFSSNVTVTNSIVRVDTAATRSAVATNANTSVFLNVHHSLLLCGQAGSATVTSAAKGNLSTLRIGASQVDGASTGTPTCTFVYDANYNGYASGCPVPIA